MKAPVALTVSALAMLLGGCVTVERDPYYGAPRYAPAQYNQPSTQPTNRDWRDIDWGSIHAIGAECGDIDLNAVYVTALGCWVTLQHSPR